MISLVMKMETPGIGRFSDKRGRMEGRGRGEEREGGRGGGEGMSEMRGS